MYALVGFGAAFRYHTARRDREAVRRNLSAALGLRGRELKRNARMVFVNFAKYLADFMTPRISDSYAIGKNIKAEGLANIDAALKLGKGCILLGAHYGNWELGGYVLSKHGYRLHSIILEHKERRINELFRQRRANAGERPIPLGKAIYMCPEALRKNEIVAMLGDRTFGERGILVDFFGRKARMPRGAAVFSIRYECPVLPVFVSRVEGDRYAISIEAPLFPKEGLQFKEQIMDLTLRFIKIFERYIRQDPSQWYMFYDVWGEEA